MTTFTLRQGDVLDCLREIPADTFQMACTSPPYWGLRDYDLPPSIWIPEVRGASPCEGHECGDALEKKAGGGQPGEKVRWQHTGEGVKGHKAADAGAFCVLCGAWRGCLGLEPTPELYIEHMVAVFREVRRVLRPDGTLWLNIGDSYASSAGGYSNTGSVGRTSIVSRNTRAAVVSHRGRKPPSGLKPKDLVGIPWMLAFALRADGWYLRSEIIWCKPNPMPESVTDRPTKAHETIFLLSKSAKYFYDAAAIAEPSVTSGVRRPYGSQGAWDMDGRVNEQKHGGEPRSFKGSQFNTGKTAEHQLGRSSTKQRTQRSLGPKGETAEASDAQSAGARMGRGAGWRDDPANTPETRNKRSVWMMATQPFAEAHFATFPEELPRTCILAGSRPGDVVLDPFSGAGTTGVAAITIDRDYVGIELNPEYLAMSRRRLESVAPMFAKEA